jgi:hypothetical protein
MRRIVATFLIMIVVGLVFAGSAVAATISGFVYFYPQSYVSGATVYIGNNTTGAQGSTTSASDGSYSFVNAVVGDSYSVDAVYVPNCFEYYSDIYTNTLVGDWLVDLPLTGSYRWC